MQKKENTHSVRTGRVSTAEQQLKKSVGAIHSSGNLTLVQRKLANILLYAAYDDLLSKRTHTIPVSIMCAMLGWEESNRVDYLKEALLALQKTVIQFNLREDGHDVWESMAMLSYAHIKNGVCTWRYDEALAEKLFNPSMFALININIQRHLDTAYALNLYENLYRFRNTNQGSTGIWSLQFFREIIGATASYYDDYPELNRKVIKPSIEKINKDTDINVTVKTEKKSRQVVGLTFYVQEKSAEEKSLMPNTLPGTSPKDLIDAFSELRKTEAFKALRKHGISERLAFATIQEKGEQAVIDLVAYTEERDAQHLIKTNTRTYLTHLVKSGAEVSQSEYEKEKEKIKKAKTKETQTEAQKKKIAELEAEFRTTRIKEARNALSLEDRAVHAAEWLETPEGQGRTGTFDPKKGKFKDGATNIAFEQVYLAKVLAKPFSQDEFVAWVQEEKKLDPAKLGF